MKIITLYLDDSEREKWYNEYHRLEAKSHIAHSWQELKPTVIEFLTEEGYKFRRNASWLVLIRILFEVCLKTKRLLIGHDGQCNNLSNLLNDKAKEEN